MTELTPEVLAKIRDILSSSTAQTKRATHVSDSTEHTYYYIEHEGYATVVSSRDASSRSEAFNVAFGDKLQPWYVIDGVMGEDDVKVQEWSHNDFCDWLRRRE